MHSLWQTSSRPDSLQVERWRGDKGSFCIMMHVQTVNGVHRHGALQHLSGTLRRFTAASHSHTHSCTNGWLLPCKALQIGDECLTQGHLGMWKAGARICTANPSIVGWPLPTSTNSALQFIFAVSSPLLDFVKELSEDGASEVAGQTAGHVVPDEGLDDGLSEKRTLHYIYQQFMDLDLVWQIKWGPCSDRIIARPNQAVDLIVVRRLGVGVSVLSQRLAGIPVASQTFLI